MAGSVDVQVAGLRVGAGSHTAIEPGSWGHEIPIRPVIRCSNAGTKRRSSRL